MLLLVRVALFITASLTLSYNPQVIVVFVGGLLFLNRYIRNLKVYKKSITDVVETIMLFNLLAFAAFSLYHFKTDPIKQTAVAYTSTIITFLSLIGVIAYHVYLLIEKKNPKEINEYPLPSTQPANAGVTHSVVEVHKPQHAPQKCDSVNIGDI